VSRRQPRPKGLCSVCSTRLDPYWVELGVDVHPTCEDLECAHGEVRGTRYCALCRHLAAKGAETAPSRPVGAPTAPVGMDHPDTSHRAAERALPTSGTKRQLLLEAISSTASGMTDFEIEERFAWKHESASACRRSLVIDGWLIDSGRRRKVPDTGNEAIVWIATRAGAR
jgi:hypothetical protein